MKKLFTLLCVALVSAVGFAQDAYDPSAHTAVVSGTDNLCSGNWSSEDAMTYDSTDGLWKITLSAKDTKAIEFKVVYDGNWYGKDGGEANYKFQVSEACDVLITFDPTTLLATYSGEKVKEWDPNAITIDFIVAAGSGGLLNGNDWSVDAEANKMSAEDEGYYTLELKNVAAGTYEFKFVANGSWSEAQWGAIEGNEALENGTSSDKVTADNGKNFKITLDKGAVYDVTLTLDLMDFSKPSVTAEWKATGEAEIEEDVYSLAGTFNGWDKDDTGAELTKVSEGVYNFVRPVKAGRYEFKVVKNHDWTVAYPADNYVLELEQDADVTITLDLNNSETPVSVTTAECSVYFVSVTAKASKRDALYIYACYGESWNPLTGSWPGEKMDYAEGNYSTEGDLMVPKGESLQIIFNDGQGGDGHQSADIKLDAITANGNLVFTLNDDWTTTGIQTLAAGKANSAIYNIAGQRVEKAVRGLYITNGRKFIVK